MRQRAAAGQASQVLPILAAAMVADLSGWMLPLLVEAIAVRYALAIGTVGLLIALETTASVAAALLLAPFVGRADTRALALLGVALTFTGAVAAAVTPSVGGLFVARTVAGIGAGFASAAATSAAARQPEPARIFVAWAYMDVCIAILVCTVLPPLIERGGTEWSFGAMAMLVAVAGLAQPFRRRQGGVSPAPARASGNPAAFRLSLRLVFGAALFQVGLNGAFNFMEPIGRAAGLSLRDIANALLIASVSALGGPFLVDRFGSARRRTLMLGASLGVGGVMTAAMPLAWNFVSFTGSFTLQSMMLYCVLPAVMGLAAAMDGTGRLATSVRAATSAGNSLGPALSGWLLLRGFGFAQVGVILALMVAASMVLLLPLSAAEARAAAAQAARVAGHGTREDPATFETYTLQ